MATSDLSENSVAFFAEDWNKYSRGDAVEFFPVYTGKLHAVKLRFNKSRYTTGASAYYKFLSEAQKPLPASCTIHCSEEDFAKGIVNLEVNPLASFFSEEAIAEFLSWFAVSFLPTLQYR